VAKEYQGIISVQMEGNKPVKAILLDDKKQPIEMPYSVEKDLFKQVSNGHLHDGDVYIFYTND